MTEIDKFFEGLPSEDKKPQDIFKEPQPEEIPKPEKGEGDEEDAQPRKNRAVRRLEQKLEDKDRMLIALNNRVIELSEDRRSTEEHVPGEAPSEWIALYGDTPEAQKAWKMQEKMLSGVKAEARDEAIQEFEARTARVQEEQKGFEEFIDNELEAIEDEFNIDLTSNAPAARKTRREFLEMVQTLSPKDEDGTITGYADFFGTFEAYQKLQAQEKPSETAIRRKEIASRSMKGAGTGDSPAATQPTPGFRGWQKDYNLED